MQNNKNLSADPQAVLNAYVMWIFNSLHLLYHLFYFTVKTNRDEHCDQNQEVGIDSFGFTCLTLIHFTCSRNTDHILEG